MSSTMSSEDMWICCQCHNGPTTPPIYRCCPNCGHSSAREEEKIRGIYDTVDNLIGKILAMDGGGVRPNLYLLHRLHQMEGLALELQRLHDKDDAKPFDGNTPPLSGEPPRLGDTNPNKSSHSQLFNDASDRLPYERMQRHSDLSMRPRVPPIIVEMSGSFPGNAAQTDLMIELPTDRTRYDKEVLFLPWASDRMTARHQAAKRHVKKLETALSRSVPILVGLISGAFESSYFDAASKRKALISGRDFGEGCISESSNHVSWDTSWFIDLLRALGLFQDGPWTSVPPPLSDQITWLFCNTGPATLILASIACALAATIYWHQHQRDVHKLQFAAGGIISAFVLGQVLRKSLQGVIVDYMAWCFWTAMTLSSIYHHQIEIVAPSGIYAEKGSSYDYPACGKF